MESPDLHLIFRRQNAMLPRILEPTAADSRAEAEIYREMDHSAVNRCFVEDLINGGPVGPRVIDFGCGPAFIPILLCEIAHERASNQRFESLQVMGIDSSIEMLEIAKFELEMAGQVEAVQLQQIDLSDPEGLQEGITDTVICNTVLHHLDDPVVALRLALRCLKPGGRMFVRDLFRPDTQDEIERLVQAHGGSEVGADGLSPAQLLRQSLQASLTLAEIRTLLESIGLDPQRVQMTSDRHWTIDCRKT